MNTQSGRGGEVAADVLQTQLATWLRGFDPGEAPIRLRVRISGDLRAEREAPRRWRAPSLAGGIASTAVAAIILVGLGLLCLALVAGGMGASVGAPGPAWPSQPVPAGDLAPTYRLDPFGVAAILAAAVLVGAFVRLSPVGRFARWLIGAGEAPGPVLSFPRGVRQVPRLAVLLAALAVILSVFSTWASDVAFGVGFGIDEIGFYVATYLIAAMAPAIALRYPGHERSTRWLLLGAIGLSLAPLPGLGLDLLAWLGWLSDDWGVALSTIDPFVSDALHDAAWVALATGMAARAGVSRRPSELAVAVVAAVVIFDGVSFWTQVTGEWSTLGAGLGPLDQAMVLSWTIRNCLIEFAWLTILWVAFIRARMGGGGGWWLALVSAVATIGPLAYVYTLSGFLAVPLDHQLYMYLAWASLGALLIALLVGLDPVRPADADEAGAPGQIPVDAEPGRD
jgi:hypothetical protein